MCFKQNLQPFLRLFLLCLVFYLFQQFVVLTSVVSNETQIDQLSERITNRSSSTSMFVVKLSALNRTFLIVPSKVSDLNSVFDPLTKIIVHRDGKSQMILFAKNFSQYSFDGHLEDDPSSIVHTKLIGNVIDGIIKTKEDIFYIERSIGTNLTTLISESNVYRASDIQLDRRDSILDIPISKYGLVAKMTPEGYRDYIWKQILNAHSKMDKKKRRVCDVKILADHSFYKRVGESDLGWTVAEIELHVRETNEILENTDFDGDGQPDGYRLVVSEIEIRTDHKLDESDHYVSIPINSSVFLDSVSRLFFNGGHCLEIGLTTRKFADGVTSASHMASPSFLMPGGLCTSPITLKRITVNKTGMHLVRESIHLNTGVMTFSGHSSGSKIPRAVSVVHFANLVAHLMGSGHESQWRLPGCNKKKKNVTEVDNVHPLMIMDAMSTRRRYSPCSVSKMNLVLRAKGSCLKPKEN